jgi:hypothetical protein
MVRSTTISWKIGLAITASAIPLWQLPALADDKPVPEEVETRSAPIETKQVPVTLTPPASDSESASWRQLRKDGPPIARPGPSKPIAIWDQSVGTAPEGAPVITVRPAPSPSAQPRPQQAEPAPVWDRPPGTTAAVQPRPNAVEPTPTITVRPVATPTPAQPGPQQADPAPVWERPAGTASLAQPRPEQPETAPTVQASRKGGLLVPRPAEVEPAPIAVQPAEQAAVVQPGPGPVETTPTPAQSGLKPAILQPRPEQAETAPPPPHSGPKAATAAQPRPQPEKIQEAVARVEKPLAPEPRPRVAALPSGGDANPPLAAPSLPGRSPFRQSAFKSEVVDNPAAFRQPEQPKGNAAQRFLNNLNPWSKKEAGTPVASNAQPSAPPAGEAAQPEAAPKTPVKRLIDGIQFWKK